MNSLSWMIYFADVAGSISSLVSFVASVAFIVAAGGAITWLVTAGPPSIYSFDDREKKQASHDAFRSKVASFIRPAAIAFAAFAILATVLPSSSTIYAIAASETGERALNSETGGKAVQALNAWLDRQIAGETEPSK